MTAPPGNAKQTALANLRTKLVQYEPQFQKVIPIPQGSGYTPQRLSTLAQVAAHNNPMLLACKSVSIALSVLRIAQLGLELGDTAHIVPFGDQATVIVDYKGLVELALRNPTVKHIEARLVHANDRFRMQYGTDPKIEHDPELDDPGEIVGAYCVIFMDRSIRFDYMTVAEIEAIREGRGGAWQTHYGEMAKKTVVRRAMKLAPRTAQFTAAVALMDRQDGYQVGNTLLDEGELAMAEVEEDTLGEEQDNG